jgi:hypothetical protein
LIIWDVLAELFEPLLLASLKPDIAKNVNILLTVGVEGVVLPINHLPVAVIIL